MKPMLIGQAPGARAGGAPLTGGSTGRRLARLLGVSAEDLPRLLRLRNLLGEFPGKSGKGDAFPAADARAAARRARPRGVVLLLGRGVAAAFGEGARPFLRWFRSGGARAAVFPHPSGVSRWWNDPRNARRAGAFLRRVVSELDDNVRSCVVGWGNVK